MRYEGTKTPEAVTLSLVCTKPADTYTYAHKVLPWETSVISTITLNTSGFATYACTAPLDFSGANDYTAWQITGVSGNTISFQQITGSVAAGTGVLLWGTASTEITLTTTASGDDISDTNKLQGITKATDIAADVYYGLSGSAFVKVNAGTVPAGKAVLPASALNGSEVKSLVFQFEGADGIDSVKGAATATGVIYDLSGRRVNNVTRGLYIVDGRKVMVK